MAGDSVLRRICLVLSSVFLYACSTSTAENPPSDAVRVDDDLYMVPVRLDDTGCQEYSGWSRTRVLSDVIYYRKADGTFTMHRSEAHCSEQG